MSSTPNARFGGQVWPLLLRLGLVSHAVEKQKSWKGEKDLCRSEIRTRVKQSTLHVSPEHKRRQNQGPWFSAHPQTGREARTDSGEAQFLVFNDKQVASPLAKKVKKSTRTRKGRSCLEDPTTRRDLGGRGWTTDSSWSTCCPPQVSHPHRCASGNLEYFSALFIPLTTTCCNGLSWLQNA